MKKAFNILISFIYVITYGLFLTSCKNKEVYIPPRNITQNLPDKIFVVYNASEYYGGLIFVKDGNEYYVNGKNKWYADRREIYMKTNLTNEVCKAENGQGWGFISAHWNGTNWILAEDETEYTPLSGTWHANDHNQSTYTETEVITRTGYIDINTSILTNVTITQLENQTVTLRSGQQVECVVWDYVYNNESADVYSHNRYWYAVDTGIYIKEMYTFDKNVNIETDGNTGENIATYYKVGDSMGIAMEFVSTQIGETRTKYIFDPKYK